MDGPRHLPASGVHEAQGCTRWGPPLAPFGEADAFLSLAAARGIGPKTLFDWAEAGYSFRAILAAGPPDHATGWAARRREAEDRAEEMRALLQKLDIDLILRADPRFPTRLLDLARPPNWLFVQGSVVALHAPSVAIVGTRKPSDDGVFLARYVGACLADWGVPSVSGLAAGIDQLAHDHSLRAGVPTIAVLGTGIPEDYLVVRA